MEIIIPILWIIVGFILLIKGAEFLVDGSSSIAKKAHIPQIIIGLTIVSIGTTMPEFFVSTTSAINGYSDMAMGNVIGSNICNLLLILGLSSIVRAIKFQRETRLIEIPMILAITIIFTITCNTNNMVSRNEAILLILLFIMFISYTIIMSRKGKEFDGEIIEENYKDISIIKNVIIIILGVIALKFGGDFTVNNAVIIAQHFNISEQIISLTILAIGTSLPELVTGLTAAVKGNSDIAIGNIIGANILNMLLIIGICATISPITYNPVYNLELAIITVAIMLLALFPFIPPKNTMSRSNGIIYFVSYLAYMAILFNI